VQRQLRNQWCGDVPAVDDRAADRSVAAAFYGTKMRIQPAGNLPYLIITKSEDLGNGRHSGIESFHFRVMLG